MLNYAYILEKQLAATSATPSRHTVLPSNPVLVKPLPPSREISRRAQEYAAAARKQHALTDALSSAVESPLEAQPSPRLDAGQQESLAGDNSPAKSGGVQSGKGKGRRGAGQYEPFEVLRAIEKKDLAVILDVKAHQFDLIITSAPGQPLPLVYAIRLGKSHREMCIILVGAMSRRVNDTTDDELAQKDPATLATLRAVRANLKIAIQASLSGPDGDTSLLSSFLQVIVMLEGHKFLQASTADLSLALRNPLASKPVATAQKLMLKWVSRELAARQVATVEEYVANAVGDLILLGIWSIVQDQVREAEEIPLYYFARDDRIQKAVEERLSDLRRVRAGAGLQRISKSVRTQLDVALDVLGRRSLNGRERVERLRRVLDEGEKLAAVSSPS